MSMWVKMLPPSPVMAPVPVDMRISYQSPDCGLTVKSYVEYNGERREIYSAAPELGVNNWQSAQFKFDGSKQPGLNHFTFEVTDANGKVVESCHETLEVFAGATRSPGLIDGAWCGMYHWSEAEGRLWNKELKQFTAEDWQNLVRDMHKLGMHVIILQELFRNEQYYGKHDMEQTGYFGKAFYPSALYPGRMDIACNDPVEAIMAAADDLGMAVLPGVGMYAWFDFTPGSLEWHKKVAKEIFDRYGHHKSFFGWYISEEVFGELKYGPGNADTEKYIVDFFHEFREFKNTMNPALPVMLAPNCFYVNRTEETWRKLARELDIICPFAFHRMNPDDLSCAEVIALFQNIVDENGAHLWLDLEVFNFTDDMALYPREVESIVNELLTFENFEKILCYQYPGLFNAPGTRLTPGGPQTVEHFKRYFEYYQKHLAELRKQK